MKNLLLAIFLVLYCSDSSQACEWVGWCVRPPVPMVYVASPAPLIPVPAAYSYSFQFVPIVYSVPVMVPVQQALPVVVPVVPIVPVSYPVWIPYRY